MRIARDRLDRLAGIVTPVILHERIRLDDVHRQFEAGHALAHEFLDRLKGCAPDLRPSLGIGEFLRETGPVQEQIVVVALPRGRLGVLPVVIVAFIGDDPA